MTYDDKKVFNEYNKKERILTNTIQVLKIKIDIKLLLSSNVDHEENPSDK